MYIRTYTYIYRVNPNKSKSHIGGQREIWVPFLMAYNSPYTSSG